MDTFNDKLVKFNEDDISIVYSNLYELLQKITIQLSRNDLEVDEIRFLKSNLRVLQKFKIKLNELYHLEENI